MNKNNQVYFQDISQAISQIEKYTSNISFDEFLKDDMRQDAVIRQLEVIGEAANRISKDFLTTNPDFPLKEAIRMRNFLIHGYDEVNLKVVWKTVQEDEYYLKKVY